MGKWKPENTFQSQMQFETAKGSILLLLTHNNWKYIGSIWRNLDSWKEEQQEQQEQQKWRRKKYEQQQQRKVFDTRFGPHDKTMFTCLGNVQTVLGWDQRMGAEWEEWVVLFWLKACLNSFLSPTAWLSE